MGRESSEISPTIYSFYRIICRRSYGRTRKSTVIEASSLDDNPGGEEKYQQRLYRQRVIDVSNNTGEEGY